MHTNSSHGHVLPYQHVLGTGYDSTRPCNIFLFSGVADRISVGIGAKLLELIPGRVSTECDARLAYDTEATIAKARRLVGLYADRGVSVERLYIKIASTWDGVQACEQLQREGVSTNMTLLFDFAQVCASTLPLPRFLHV